MASHHTRMRRGRSHDCFRGRRGGTAQVGTHHLRRELGRGWRWARRTRNWGVPARVLLAHGATPNDLGPDAYHGLGDPRGVRERARGRAPGRQAGHAAPASGRTAHALRHKQAEVQQRRHPAHDQGADRARGLRHRDSGTPTHSSPQRRRQRAERPDEPRPVGRAVEAVRTHAGTTGPSRSARKRAPTDRERTSRRGAAAADRGGHHATAGACADPRAQRNGRRARLR